MAHVIYRHGERTPTNFFLQAEDVDSNIWNNLALGELTKNGKLQEYQLGSKLRDRYINKFKMVSHEYISKETYFRSSGVERCLMSAQLQAAGLFPPDINQKFDDSILWQPIPIQTVSPKRDFMLRYFDVECPKLHNLISSIFNTDKWKKLELENELLTRLLSSYLKSDITAQNMYEVTDFITYIETYGNKIPKWYDETLSNKTLNLTRIANEMFFCRPDKQFKILTSGTLFTEILNLLRSRVQYFKTGNEAMLNKLRYLSKNNELNDEIEEEMEMTNNDDEVSHNTPYFKNNDKMFYKSQDIKEQESLGDLFKSIHYETEAPVNNERKLYFYSTHDYIIQSFLNLLGQSCSMKVEYAAALAIELYSHKNELYVEMVYKNGHEKPFLPLDIPLCDKPCKFSSFEDLFKKYIVNDIETQCHVPMLDISNSKIERIVVWSILIAYSLTISITLVVQVIRFHRFQKKTTGYQLVPNKDKYELN